MKRFLCILLSLMSILVCFACNEPHNNDIINKEDKIILNVDSTTKNIKFFNWAVNYFNNDKNIKIKVVENADKYDISVVNKSISDISQFIDLQDVYNQHFKDSFSVTTNVGVSDNIRFGIAPYGQCDNLLYYNKHIISVMTEGNILSMPSRETMKKVPTNIDELVRWGEIFIEGGHRPLVISKESYKNILNIILSSKINDNEYEKLFSLKYNKDDKKFVEIFTKTISDVKKIVDANILGDDYRNLSKNELIHNFISNDIKKYFGMMVGSSEDLFFLSKELGTGLGVTYFPVKNDVQKRYTLDFNDLVVINKDTKYLDECKQFVSFLASKNAQKKVAEYNYFPVLSTVNSSYINQNLRFIYDDIKFNNTHKSLVNDNTWANKLQDIFTSILNKEDNNNILNRFF